NNLRRINPPEGFDSHPGHQCAFSNTETPERSPKKNAEAHLRSLPQKGFRSQHHRFSLQSPVCYARSFAAIARRARLSRLRSKRLPRRYRAAHSAQILFLRRFLARPSARCQIQFLVRQTRTPSLAGLRFLGSLYRPAEQRTSAKVVGGARLQQPQEPNVFGHEKGSKRRAPSRGSRKKGRLSISHRDIPGCRRRRPPACCVSRLP